MVHLEFSRAHIKILVIFALGIFSLMAGVFFTILKLTGYVDDFPILPFVLLILGCALVFCALIFYKNAMLLYFGLDCHALGIIILLVRTKVFEISISEIWPLIVIIFGFLLFPVGFFRYKKARTIYIFPAIAMIFLGTVFTLFSFRIIKMSFSQFVYMWWPIMLIVFGIALLSIFVWQRRYKTIFPYVNENDDEMSIDDSAAQETEKISQTK